MLTRGGIIWKTTVCLFDYSLINGMTTHHFII